MAGLREMKTDYGCAGVPRRPSALRPSPFCLLVLCARRSFVPAVLPDAVARRCLAVHMHRRHRCLTAASFPPCARVCMDALRAKLYAQSIEVERIAKQIGVPQAEIAPLEHGSVPPLGSSGQMEILHTPGHSAGSICVRVQPTASAEQAFILSGDCIFPGSCGRLDLPDSDTVRHLLP